MKYLLLLLFCSCSYPDIFIQKEKLCVKSIREVHRGTKVLFDVTWTDSDRIFYTERVETLTDKIGDCKIFLVR